MRLSVVFVVDDKIKEQLRRLSNESILEFILGRDDSNVFEAHMLAIEELDDYCECIMKVFARRDIPGIAKEKILYENETDLIILVDKENTRSVLSFIEAYSSASALLYDKQMQEKAAFVCSDYTCRIALLKHICLEAVNKKESLLFCIDKT